MIRANVTLVAAGAVPEHVSALKLGQWHRFVLLLQHPIPCTIQAVPETGASGLCRLTDDARIKEGAVDVEAAAIGSGHSFRLVRAQVVRLWKPQGLLFGW